MSEFIVQFNDTETAFDVQFDSTQYFDAVLDNVVRIVTDPYEGEYTVTPRLYVQSLETEGKSMENDVTIYEIPIVKTSNIEGGLTVLVG